MAGGGAVGGVVLNCRTCTRACKQYKSLHDEIEIAPAPGGCNPSTLGSGNVEATARATTTTTTLSKMLNFCTSLSFEQRNGASTMPQHICLHCIHLLEQSFNFKRMVIDSDELLRLGLDEVELPAVHNETREAGTVETEVDEEEYMMIEMLNEQGQVKTLIDDPVVSLDGVNEEEEEELVVEEHQHVMSKEVVEEEEEEEIQSAAIEEFVIEEINEDPHLDMEYSDVEYVTIKSEYASLVANADEIEVTNEMIEGEVIVMPQAEDESLDEVIEMNERTAEEQELEDDQSPEQQQEQQEEEVYMNESELQTTASDVLPFSCAICQKSFRQMCRLNQHMRSHIDEKLFSCEKCGKKLKHLRNYKEHMLTHSNVKPHQCNICARFYRTTSSLAAHKHTHAEDKPYKCEQCGRGYAALDHLKRHKLTHTGERPYACDLCDKAYYDSSSLRQHKVSHTGEKAFRCEICGVGLSQKSGYKKHMLVHSGEKPHKCPICGRAFTFTSNLNAHVRLHSGEKPFKCEICEKAFPTKKRLNSHLRIHTKDGPRHFAAHQDVCESGAGDDGADSGALYRLADVTADQASLSTSKVDMVLLE
ncbi:uncharacterized protein dwg [Drosophila tropicalis]|uniref:uncharacterized protein dwg n=1 Tax=Drosophila tropicalis TaxID=46794 RepID=UPI0035AB9E29